MDRGTTCQKNDTTESGKFSMALELSQMEWELGFNMGFGQAPRLRSIAARRLQVLMEEIRLTLQGSLEVETDP